MNGSHGRMPQLQQASIVTGVVFGGILGVIFAADLVRTLMH